MNLEACKLRGEAVLLERAARVLDRTSRATMQGSCRYTASWWLDVKATLWDVARAKRAEADELEDSHGRSGPGTAGGPAEGADIRCAAAAGEGRDAG